MQKRMALGIPVNSWHNAIAGLLLSLIGHAGAQPPMLEDFNLVANGSIYALAVQPDGKILVGGSFTILAGQTNEGLARLNADGTVDRGFFHGAGGATPWIYSLALQPDGKILVGGTFTTLGGQPCTNLGRLNLNGTLDNSFRPLVNGGVYALALQTDGKILVGGGFTSLNDQPRTNIARLFTNGGMDTGFDSRTDGAVFAVAVQPDGRILVGGNFNSVNEVPCTGLVRLNAGGIYDTGFHPVVGGGGIYGATVSTLTLQADGKILVGGSFTTMEDKARVGIARINEDGSLDNGFDPKLTGHGLYSPFVFSLVVQSDAKIVMGGFFSEVDGHPCTNIAKINADGTLENSFYPGTPGWMSVVAMQGDGQIVVSDQFDTVNFEPRSRVVRLSDTAPTTQNLTCNGSQVTWLRSGAGPEVWRTTFEVSTNGNDWFMLGAGTRIAGGWELTNVALPSSGLLRARGFTSGGYRNASSWFVETRLGLGASTRPIIGLSDGKFGIGTDGFGFPVTGSSATSVVLEASTNLMQWLPVETNYFGSGAWYFSDPDPPQLPQRFYRVRQWP